MLRAVTSESIGQRHASACSYKSCATGPTPLAGLIITDIFVEDWGSTFTMTSQHPIPDTRKKSIPPAAVTENASSLKCGKGGIVRVDDAVLVAVAYEDD